MAGNALQAVLDRAARGEAQDEPTPAVDARKQSAPKKAATKQKRAASPAAIKSEPAEGKFYRPVRDGRRFIGAHFPPEVARQMRLIAAEDDTTIQALLEEAIDLLFAKKGRAKIESLMNS